MTNTESQPFAPPEEGRDDLSAGAVVVGIWAFAGASIGTATGATLEVLGMVSGVASIGILTGGLSGFVGFFAFLLERRLSHQRPAVADSRGRMRRPMRGWIYGMPLFFLVAGLMVLVVIGSVRSASVIPGLLFLVAAVGLMWFGRPLLSSSRLTQALQAAESGDPESAVHQLEDLHKAWWATRSGRNHARLNLGFFALQRGALDEAASWYLLATTGASAGFSASGLALIRVLQGKFAEAESCLASAAGSRAGKALQGEIDGVRLLLILRKDGPEAARELGDRLTGPGMGSLFLGILAAAHRQTGDLEGATRVLDGVPPSPLANIVAELANA